MLADSISNDSQGRKAALDGIRAGSKRLRMAAKSPSREAARAVMSSLQMSQKEFAIKAGVPESTVSDALASLRPFDADWPLLQGEPFRSLYLERLGKHSESAKSLALRLLSEAQRVIAEGVA